MHQGACPGLHLSVLTNVHHQRCCLQRCLPVMLPSLRAVFSKLQSFSQHLGGSFCSERIVIQCAGVEQHLTSMLTLRL